MRSKRPWPPLGWEFTDPDPVRLSTLYDTPPVAADPVDLVHKHQAWRARVEQRERQDRSQRDRQPVWFPVPPMASAQVVTVFGGTAKSWGNLITNLAVSAIRAGYPRVRVVNLTRQPVLDRLRSQAGREFALRHDTVSGTGSTIDPFHNLTPAQLIGLIVDVHRAEPGKRGTLDATRAADELREVGRRLSGRVSLERLSAALDTALGSGDGSSLSATERRALSDYHADVVSRRQPTAERLTDLLRDVNGLLRCGRSQRRSADRLGVGGSRGGWVRAVEAGAGSGAHDHERARELLARTVAYRFADPPGDTELLIVAGAEHLAPEVRDDLIGSAQRMGKRLALLAFQIDDVTKDLLGHPASGATVFLSLPRYDDAEQAANFLGFDFTFVVNGHSISESDTTSWNTSQSDSVTSTHSRGSSWSPRFFVFAKDFGKTVSNSLSEGTTHTAGTGGSTQRGKSINVQRVREHVVPPEKFQKLLGEDTMLVVRGTTVKLVNNDSRLLTDAYTAKSPLAISP